MSVNGGFSGGSGDSSFGSSGGMFFSTDAVFSNAVISAKNEKRKMNNYVSVKYENRFDDFSFFSPNDGRADNMVSNSYDNDKDSEFLGGVDDNSKTPSGNFGFNGISAFGGIDFSNLSDDEDELESASDFETNPEEDSMFDFFEDFSQKSEPLPVKEESDIDINGFDFDFDDDVSEEIETVYSADSEEDNLLLPKEDLYEEEETDETQAPAIPLGEGVYTARTGKHILLTVGVFAAFFMLVIVSVIATFSSALGNGEIYDGVLINKKNVGGMTKEEVAAYVQTTYIDPINNANITIKLGENSKNYSLAEFVKCPNAQEIADKAYNVARYGSMFSRMRQISALKDNNYSISILYDIVSDSLDDVMNSATDISFSLPVDPSYDVRSDSVVFTSGKNGTNIDTTRFKSDLYDALNDFTEEIESLGENGNAVLEDIVVEIGTATVEFNKLVPQEIYDAVYIEPKAAYYYKESNGSISVYPHSVGRALELDELNSLVNRINNGEDIPYAELKFVYNVPNKTTEKLKNNIFSTVVSEFSSENVADVYCKSEDKALEERDNNFRLFAEKLNGVTLVPGESFSFIKTVGAVTKDFGFVSAYENSYNGGGKFVGAGISQVATAVYTAALKADLTAVAHSNSYYLPRYGILGLDAYINAEKEIDLVIKNTRDYPVKFNVSYTERTIYISLEGTDEGISSIEFSSENIRISQASDGVKYDYKVTRKYGGSTFELDAVSYVEHGATLDGATEIPSDTESPSSSVTPDATEVPSETESPSDNTEEPTTAPTDDPVSDTDAPSETDIPSETPSLETEVPVVVPETETPETETPETATPAVSEAPAETEVPVETEASVETEVPADENSEE